MLECFLHLEIKTNCCCVALQIELHYLSLQKVLVWYMYQYFSEMFWEKSLHKSQMRSIS